MKPNNKSKYKSPERHDNDAKIASLLMDDSIYPKAFSEHIAPDDFRREDINKFRLENKNVTKILEEIAFRKAEIVDKTPFDLYEDKSPIFQES